MAALVVERGVGMVSCGIHRPRWELICVAGKISRVVVIAAMWKEEEGGGWGWGGSTLTTIFVLDNTPISIVYRDPHTRNPLNVSPGGRRQPNYGGARGAGHEPTLV